MIVERRMINRHVDLLDSGVLGQCVAGRNAGRLAADQEHRLHAGGGVAEMGGGEADRHDRVVALV